MIIFMLLISAGETSEVKTKCINKINFHRSDSPWRDMTGSYEEERASMRVSAAEYNSSKFSTVAGLEKYNISGIPLIFRAHGKKMICVNQKYFSVMDRADATRVGSGEEIKIGKFLDLKFSSIAPDKLVSFLIESGIIITCWHVESEVCLEREIKTASDYTAYFSGNHTYFTNEKNVDPLRFAVRVSLADGSISLLGY
jgi:hypothetical protein